MVSNIIFPTLEIVSTIPIISPEITLTIDGINLLIHPTIIRNGYVITSNIFPPILINPSINPVERIDDVFLTNIPLIQLNIFTNGCINASYNAPPIALIPTHIPFNTPSLNAAPISLNLVNKLPINPKIGIIAAITFPTNVP